MRTLHITIERMGERVPVGTISGNDYRDACFSYSEDWLESKNAAPVSISLPLQAEPFSADQTRAFFDGLLPEGFTRRSVAQWVHADENDYLSILAVLGEECIGAIQVRESDAPGVVSGYEPLSADRVRELAQEGASRSAQIITKTHLSLAGATGKVGLFYESQADRWYLPLGNAPSTHIVKQSHVRLNNIVINEQLCMMTAERLGIDVPESFIVNTGNGGDEDVLFATRRYDRTMPEEISETAAPSPLKTADFADSKSEMLPLQIADSPDNTSESSPLQTTDSPDNKSVSLPLQTENSTDGKNQTDLSFCRPFHVPLRLHQEDFAQAMGIPSVLKYEKPEDAYLKGMFDLLRRVSANPIQDQLKLWDILIYDFLIGNTDGHIKNFSLLYSPDLMSIRLAPAYDMISTIVYEESTRNMAVGIGGIYDIDEVGPDAFERAASEAGLGRKMAMQHFEDLKDRFEEALTESARQLSDSGFANAPLLRDKILEHAIA